ncbi:hypothetical protein SLA2020_471290 [Shorea laevis]
MKDSVRYERHFPESPFSLRCASAGNSYSSALTLFLRSASVGDGAAIKYQLDFEQWTKTYARKEQQAFLHGIFDLRLLCSERLSC